MGLRAHKPTSPGRRNSVTSDFSEITKSSPEKSLLAPLTKKGGRNNRGRITVRHRGGGHKRRYRIVDFARAASKSEATVLAIEYDPNRSARIALVRYEDGAKKYVIAPDRLGVGDKIRNGEDAPVTPGNAMKVGHLPPGTYVHNIELIPGNGGQLVRSAGVGVRPAELEALG